MVGRHESGETSQEATTVSRVREGSAWAQRASSGIVRDRWVWVCYKERVGEMTYFWVFFYVKNKFLC